MAARHIGSATSFFMVLTALLIDAVEFVLELLLIGILVNGIIDICAALLFGIWFGHHGVSIARRRPLGFLATLVIGFAPGLNMLPEWTVFVLYTLRMERARERAEGAI